ASLVITPESIAVHQAVITTPKTKLSVRGSVTRPLASESLADLSLEFDDVAVAQIRHLIGWLPEIEREEAAAVVERVQSGRLVSLRASGAASLGGWQDFLAGRARTQPRNFELRAQLADTVIAVGERDRIEALKGRVEWVGKRAKVIGATALLNGEPLPRLDLVVDGFPNFFAGDRAARELASGAGALSGLGTLWRSLRPQGEAAPSEAEAIIDFHFDFLDHPMFLWPIRDLDFAIESGERGVRVERLRGRWAGVPIDGSAEWLFLPEEQVRVEVRAGPPAETPGESIPADRWARGRFSIGRIEREVWRQRAARAEFAAAGDRVRIRDLAIELEPTGVVEANGRIDLSHRDTVPFQLSFDLEAGDAARVAELFGLPSQQISGVVDLAGSFEGELVPDTSIYASLRGLLQVSARDGRIRKKAPPVAAVSRATEAIEDFDSREVIEYRRLETLLEFSGGAVHTDEFTLDGPTLGVFASGKVELVSEPRNMNGKVALFLFRRLDRVLDKIPIVSQLLLGTDENLVAVYFQVKGPWEDPTVKPILLPTSAGPASVVLQGVPLFVKRGFRSLASIMRRGPETPEDSIADGAPSPVEPETESAPPLAPGGAFEAAPGPARPASDAAPGPAPPAAPEAAPESAPPAAPGAVGESTPGSGP
ncbi:MAG TPA: AsmA-like C-terminal region-containing protein, partial [Myxococcota bacterium]|nr:AsmA-like C-terminal region-containing protein [Myxococcota bacterium]